MADDDRRIRRTRRALADALMDLASRQPYETITIREIAERADVGYATFFRHYGSRDDLMLDIFQIVGRDLEALAGRHGEEHFANEGLLIFTHVAEHAALYRSILDSLVFTRKLRKLFAEHTQRHMAQHSLPDAHSVVPLEIAVNHSATGLVNLIEWWLDHDLCPPVEQMAEIYNRLIIEATWNALAAGELSGGPKPD
jgi:AcrR family transcriptional regulator